MSLTDDAGTLLAQGPVADVGHLLKLGGRRELEAEIARLAAGGLRAHVVLVPPGTELGPLHELWGRAGYDEHRDLLLLFNGHRWEARGWGLGRPTIDGALGAAEPALRTFYGRGLAAALANLAGAAGGGPAGAAAGGGARSSALGGIALGALGLGAAAVVGWVIMRRGRRAQERRRTLAEARSAADQVFADVLLAAEDMSDADAADLRDKAGRLRDQIDALAPPALKQLPPREETLTVARLLQVENELEALRSRVLQVKRRS